MNRYMATHPEYVSAYEAEKREIAASPAEARRDLFNAEFPAPYTGTASWAMHGRWDAICDALR